MDEAPLTSLPSTHIRFSAGHVAAHVGVCADAIRCTRETIYMTLYCRKRGARPDNTLT